MGHSDVHVRKQLATHSKLAKEVKGFPKPVRSHSTVHTYLAAIIPTLAILFIGVAVQNNWLVLQ